MSARPLQRAAFLDRDGTLIEDRNFLADPAGVVLLPNAADAVRTLNKAGVLAIVVTNQSGIARGLLTEEQYTATAQRLLDLVESAEAHIDGTYYCPHFPDVSGPCACRKPGTLLYTRAAADHAIDLQKSAYIGDRLRDVLPAQALGGHGILIAGPATPVDERERAAAEFTVVDSLTAAVRVALGR